MSETDHTEESTIFSLPEEMQEDERWKKLYVLMVKTLQEEAAGVQMSTVQNLLIERIATLYVTIRYREEKGTHMPREMKELSDLWLNMSKQFTQVLKENRENIARHRETQLYQLVMTAVGEIPDHDTRYTLRDKLIGGFRAIDEGKFDDKAH